MSDTPRTDAEERDAYTLSHSSYVSADFARQLEHELVSLTRERDKLREENRSLKHSIPFDEGIRKDLEEALRESDKENDRLKRELVEAKDELERERMRLAGCGVAALDGSEEQAISGDSQYYSASYGDVLYLRRKHDALRESVEKLVKEVENRNPISAAKLLALLK